VGDKLRDSVQFLLEEEEDDLASMPKSNPTVGGSNVNGRTKSSVWQRSRAQQSSMDLKESLLQDSSAMTETAALVLTCNAAGLLLSPSDFASGNWFNWFFSPLYVFVMYLGCITASCTITMSVGKYLVYNRLSHKDVLQASLIMKKTRWYGINAYQFMIGSIVLLSVGLLCGIYLIFGGLFFVMCTFPVAILASVVRNTMLAARKAQTILLPEPENINKED